MIIIIIYKLIKNTKYVYLRRNVKHLNTNPYIRRQKFYCTIVNFDLHE